MKTSAPTTTYSAIKQGVGRGRGQIIVRGLVLLCSFAAAQGWAGERPPRFRPTVPETEIAHFSDAVRDASAALQRPLQLQDVEALITRAIAVEDTRLLGYAEARLQPLQEQFGSAIDADFLVAWIAQHRHDYATATRLLQRVLQRDPRHLGALRTRAFVSHALGDAAQLRRDCVALALAGDRDYASLCSALWQYAGGQLDAAVISAMALTHAQQDLALRDESLRLIAEIELARHQPAAALAAINALPASRPGDLRTRLRAELALDAVHTVLPDTDSSDEALYLRALAASKGGTSDATDRREQFLARLAAREQVHDEACAGLASEYFLDVTPDPERARDYARRHLVQAREPRALALARRAGVTP